MALPRQIDLTCIDDLRALERRFKVEFTEPQPRTIELIDTSEEVSFPPKPVGWLRNAIDSGAGREPEPVTDDDVTDKGRGQGGKNPDFLDRMLQREQEDDDIDLNELAERRRRLRKHRGHSIDWSDL
jgi:hypothetical protein